MKKEIGKADRAVVITLVEDYAGYETSFYAQHGISFLIDIRNKNKSKRVLFDVGQSAEPILHNMEILGISPNTIDMIFLSHCHYDHTQGLVGMLKAIKKPNIPVIAHPDLFRPNFVLKPFLRSIGMLGENTKENIEKNGGKLILTRSPFSLMYGLISTGEIGKKVDFEEETKPVTYTIDQEGKIQEDKVLDDISLIVSLPDGVVVISGCSHAGIVSILERAKEIAKEPRIKAVIGGFHLIDADKERIDKTLRQLEEMKVGKVYAGHCTGIRAECKFLKKFGNRFVKLHCGKIIEF